MSKQVIFHVGNHCMPKRVTKLKSFFFSRLCQLLKIPSLQTGQEGIYKSSSMVKEEKKTTRMRLKVKHSKR